MEELIFILRNLINDTDSSLYTDDSLLNLLCVASFFVITETPFIEGYIVNLKEKTITPDPTYATTADVPFMTLIALKAAYMLLNNEAKAQTLNSIRVTDGPSTIDLKDRWKSIDELARARKDEYDKMKMKLTMEYEGGGGLAIMSPTTVATIMYNFVR